MANFKVGDRVRLVYPLGGPNTTRSVIERMPVCGAVGTVRGAVPQDDAVRVAFDGVAGRNMDPTWPVVATDMEGVTNIIADDEWPIAVCKLELIP